MALSDKQKRFIKEYLVDLNARQAAIRAGYSPRTAGLSGSSNIRNPLIAAAIDQAMCQRSDTIDITQEKVLQELMAIAFANPKNIASWGPDGVHIRDSDMLTDGEAALVAEITQMTGERVKIKMYDRLRALELLGRHLGMFKEKIELSGTVGVADRLEAAARRLRETAGATGEEKNV